MIFYHVSKDLTHGERFKPRIPRITCAGEDESIKRICVGQSIEDCLSSMPGGGSLLGRTVDCQYGLFKVFVFDTLASRLSESDVLDSITLYKAGLVPDALCTNEHWILKPITATDSYIVRIYDWEEKFRDIIPPDLYDEAMVGGEDYTALYKANNGEFSVPSASLINNLKYETWDRNSREKVFVNGITCYKEIKNSSHFTVVCCYEDWKNDRNILREINSRLGFFGIPKTNFPIFRLWCEDHLVVPAVNGKCSS